MFSSSALCPEAKSLVWQWTRYFIFIHNPCGVYKGTGAVGSKSLFSEWIDMTKYMFEKNCLQYADVGHASFQVIIRSPIFVQYK